MIQRAFTRVFLLLVAPLAFGAAAPPPSSFTDDQLLAAVKRDLTGYFRLEGDLDLEMLRPWTPPETQASNWAVVVTEYPSVPSDTMVVRCRVLGDGAAVDDVTLVLRASLWRDAWFTRQPLAAGSAFDPAVLEARRVDVFRERNALAATAGDGSYIFSRQVPADRLLSWNDIARRPLVRKGEIVDVIASEGMLFVSLRALALESGAQGQMVIVRNLESRKDISAVVVADNRVEVNF
jgi:flagella basal body P-ring formation protein FlgA